MDSRWTRRGTAFIPVLLPSLGPTAMTVAIRNVGPGAAFEIAVRLRFIPVADGTAPEERELRLAVLSSDDQRDYLPPGELNDNLNTLTADYRDIRLQGTMHDAAGRVHIVDESFPDLPEWRRVLGDAHQRYVAADPERRLAEALAKQFDQPLGQIRMELSSIAQAAARLAPAPYLEEWSQPITADRTRRARLMAAVRRRLPTQRRG